MMYTEEQISQFVVKAKEDLSKCALAAELIVNKLLATSISETYEDPNSIEVLKNSYDKLRAKMNALIESNWKKIDLIPEYHSEYEGIVSMIDTLNLDLSNLVEDVIDELQKMTSNITEFNTTLQNIKNILK